MFVLFTFCLGGFAACGFSGSLRKRLQHVLVDIISQVINMYLLLAKPIRTIDGSSVIPTCTYRWPNGQGDIAKFLDGEKNSEAWNKTHGHVYRIWSGTTPEIVVTQPEHIRAIFKDSDKHTKAVNNDAGWLMGELLGKCLGLISGEAWRNLHAASSVPFTHKNAASYTLQITNMVQSHFAKLAANGTLKRGVLHPVDDLRFLPFWIAVDILYGELSSAQRRDLEAIIPIREDIFNRMLQGGVTRFSWSRFFPTTTNRKLRQFKRMWSDFNAQAYHLAKKDSNVPIVDLYEAVNGGSASLDQVLETLDEMLFANLDVTMGGLSWNLLFLARDTAVQDSIREEWHTFATKTPEDSQKAWTEYIKSPSTLLAASILESARLKPLAAFSVPQSAPSDRIIGDYVVPAGTNVIVDTYALNIRNPFWGPDREEYRPSRFLQGRSLDLRYQYWRFGFGPRQCLGKYVVNIILRATLAHLVTNYRLSLLETTHWEKNAQTWIAHPNIEIRCVPLAS